MNFNTDISLADCITWGITILGFIIAICQFVKQMNKDRENRVIENKTTWFLNVIVLPHLDKIHEFYKDLNTLALSKRQSLDESRNSPHTTFIEQKATAQREIKKDIVNFFDFLNPLISSHSNALGLEIQKIKNELEDLVIKFLDEENVQTEILPININNNKQKLLQKLNGELSLNHD